MRSFFIGAIKNGKMSEGKILNWYWRYNLILPVHYEIVDPGRYNDNCFSTGRVISKSI
jgi:hypothetical protein